jgi:hypothetical protein
LPFNSLPCIRSFGRFLSFREFPSLLSPGFHSPAPALAYCIRKSRVRNSVASNCCACLPVCMTECSGRVGNTCAV